VQVLHLAPHPDDELIGAPATLMTLRDAGHHVVNFACSLGEPKATERRRAELEDASRRAGFELVVSREPFERVSTSPPDVRSAAARRLAAELDEVMSARAFDLVVGPSPHDRHPAHELVARAAAQVLGDGRGPARWWLWRLWGELPLPTTIVGFGEDRMHAILEALATHRGEVGRNDYADLVAGRARADRVLAAELVFGFGSRGLTVPYAEVTTELVRDEGGWLLGSGRLLDPGAAFPPPSGPEVSWWLNAPSVSDRLAAAGRAAPA
jgi:LmbE family N-acetylglucosaminyl deacetylase